MATITDTQTVALLRYAMAAIVVIIAMLLKPDIISSVLGLIVGVLIPTEHLLNQGGNSGDPTSKAVAGTG